MKTFFVTSCMGSELKRFHRMCPHVKLGAISTGFDDPTIFRKRLASITKIQDVDVFIIHFNVTDQTFINEAHNNGKKVFASCREHLNEVNVAQIKELGFDGMLGAKKPILYEQFKN